VQSTTLSAGIITNRRAIESNVLVDDGQIIVLGGLIEERIEGNEDKVPGLGDVPVVGQLFRYDSRKRVKTNLLVFLRPVIVRDGSDAHGITADRYDYIRGLRGDSTLPSHWALPDLKPMPLPPMPPAPPREPKRPAGEGPQQGGALAPAPGAAPREGAPAAGLAAQPPAPVSASRPSTVIQTAPNEVVVPLRPGTALVPASGS